MPEVEEIQDQFITPPPEEEYVDFSSNYVPSFYIDTLQERQKPNRETVRVILGQLGQFVRMSAPEIGIVTEGLTPMEAWEKFLNTVKQRDDCAWLAFDVGPTRPDEIAEGLNAPEDEDWSEPLRESEDD